MEHHRMSTLRPLAAALSIAFASCIVSSAATARTELAAAVSIPPVVRGAIPVTNCNDSGSGSLREAYFNALDGDAIDLSNVGCSTITLTTGALTNSPSADSVTLIGPGKYDLTIDGGNANRVFVHNGDAELVLIGMTVTNGSYSGIYGGGCLYSYGDVIAEYAIFSNCSLSAPGTNHAYGGAIYAHGTVETIYSTIKDSTATSPQGNSGGGAIWANQALVLASTITGNSVSGDGSHYARGGGVAALGAILIGYSLVSDNTADSGGGVFMFGAGDTLQVSDSTISGNHARGAAGGVYSKYRPVTVANSTITQNTAVFDFGAGLYLAAGADLQSNIIAGNTSNDGLRTSDVGGNASAAITGANNLVIDSTLTLPVDTILADPMLGPLQDNGGRTWTHALLPGSPAIDHGNNVLGIDIDQRAFDDTVSSRGYERVVGPSADIGAFEFGAPDTIFFDGFDGQEARPDGI
jgi:hypothetical protein